VQEANFVCNNIETLWLAILKGGWTVAKMFSFFPPLALPLSLSYFLL
jgi:hypothetical protein